MTTDIHGGSLGRNGRTRRVGARNGDRIAVAKTYKLFINGQFPRTESGRSFAVNDRRGRTVAHLCHASRKDLRDAVEAARGAEAKWSGMDAALRGQILYRLAEMLEARADEFADALEVTRPPSRGRRQFGARDEVIASVDRIVSFAGWTDKFQQLLGHRHPVAGPYHVFSVPGPCGVTAVVAPDEPPLLGLVSLCAPALCVGATVVALASERHPLVAALLGEALATSDLPPGVINILTGFRAELLPHIGNHREIRALTAANLTDEESTLLRRGGAENLKRVSVRDRATLAAWYDAPSEHGPDRLEPFVDLKTIWHPSAC